MQGKKVLVVDDEAGVRDSLAAILTLEGYDVSSAASGPEAVSACRDTAYDVILLDIRMPGMGGIAALEQILADRSDARVIMITGDQSDDLAARAMAAGAEALFRKPLDIATFLPVIIG